jgi:hypothetical protein
MMVLVILGSYTAVLLGIVLFLQGVAMSLVHKAFTVKGWSSFVVSLVGLACIHSPFYYTFH